MTNKVFPSILPGKDKEFVDDSYTEQELERMDGNGAKSLISGGE